MRVLIVEDEAKIAKSLSAALDKEGIQSEIASDGKAGEVLIRSKGFDCIVLDVNLPYMNGLELCKIAKQVSTKVPILMLTAFGELEDKLNAFDSGADDYLTKPFYTEEFLARIKVLLRRNNTGNTADEIIQIEDLEINKSTKEVKRAGIPIKLTTKEYHLLELLAGNIGRPISKAQIAEDVWDIHFDTGTNTIEVYINFLRKKIDRDFELKLIHTKPGFGYYLKGKE